MSKTIKQNYLSKENGCSILRVSCERQGALASSIINENRKTLWVIEEPLPQYCIINTAELRNKPKVFNRVGFYCWHQYESNPQLIEVAYTDNQEQGWNVVAKIRLELSSEKQYFKIKQIPVTSMKMIKLTILKNFGDKHTYLNQVELGYVKEGEPSESREKTFSEYVKLTSTQRQLKRALEQISKLTAEQDKLKTTVIKQTDIIAELEESLKKLMKQMHKLYETQEIQTLKINQLQGRKPVKQYKHKILPKKLSSDEQDNVDEQKQYIQDTFLGNKLTAPHRVNKSSSFAKSNRQISNHSRQKHEASKKNSKVNSVLRSRQIYNDSSLSEYEPNEDERSKHSQKCTELVHKLQKLLIEKEKRTRELEQKKKRSTAYKQRVQF